MPHSFLDSSALVKHYHAETGTAAVDKLLAEPTARHFIARLTVVEVQSAFVRKVREGKLTLIEFGVVRQRLLDEIAHRHLAVVRMTDSHYDTAEQLLRTYGPQPGQPRLRTLDALQLAVALDVPQRLGLEKFVAADHDLCVAAFSE
jgi:predicted nucleic acid-binding protein